MKNSINPILRRLGLEIRRYKTEAYGQCAYLQTNKKAKGNALVAYIVEPFLLASGETPSQMHTHHTESLLIAQAFLDTGYNVDVIDYRNSSFQPGKEYKYFISARTNFVRIANRLNHDCIKIAHLDTAHFLFNNASAYKRLLKLQQRRGITTASLKVIEHNFAVEHADYLTMLGNRFTESTYSYANKPIFPLPVPTPNVYPPTYQRDYDKCKNKFLWMGSQGVVHKGLDLVLEVFSQLPECELTVCGPIDSPAEKNFKQAFHKELFETPNINTVGWIDISSQKFKDITRNTAVLIYPSASEGQAGAVITCLQSSMIPIISYESGVDVADFGVILEKSSHEEIRHAILKIQSTPNEELEKMAHKAYDYARSHHTKEKYLSELMNVIQSIEEKTV